MNSQDCYLFVSFVCSAGELDFWAAGVLIEFRTTMKNPAWTRQRAEFKFFGISTEIIVQFIIVI